MPEKPIQGEKRAFMTGNEVVAWAAMAAGAEIMYGYPITPQNEIMHYWTRMIPKYDRRFLQTEDELSAGFTTVGGVLAGRRAFTATAGPGNTLMQEPLSMAEAMRLPVVVVVQQRGGPSTATVIYSQQEVTMTTLGGNGEGLRVVYSTATHQELFDYTIKSFNTAWKYRFPTFVLGDGYQAKMRESLMLYDPQAKGIEMVPTEAYVGKPGLPGTDRPPTHMRNTYNIEEELYEVLEQYLADYAEAAPQIAEYEAFDTEDADLVIVSHGVVSRACKSAVKELREAGYKVGYFRPITLRPLPVDQLRETAGKCQQMLVVESANGQLDRLVKEAIYGSTVEMLSLFKPGVGITSEEVVARVKEIKG
ncbi:2-oxoglutarate ferredoxin oxidoreductase subunit alpha [Desulfotomaculum arcticum]|uniref:2-oxoglutarate ferredoxin oxidoreductase subunit alpha n=1 Tax=Desulfotruncus arcticus DSM 17038 TaxID=1121424 RepID=A0A1I2WDG6_9FIRM|nr:ferredoxin oxidoreductase [Desulfotruncus arcticus]SFG98759.1 2-oxoglutarate ferredoxin oxidoreductase subunit alpha [Desulfotomaculum arcticum] [Desulfotruncus arcticus DSM 17038]